VSLRNVALPVAGSISASSASCFAQELENFPDSALTGEQWQQRVQDARRRSEEFVASARTQTADRPPSDKKEAEPADQRAMNDPSLRRGDIIATSQGFVVFVGRENEEHEPDFLPAPNPQYSPVKSFATARQQRKLNLRSIPLSASLPAEWSWLPFPAGTFAKPQQGPPSYTCRFHRIGLI
jgi:hypothetical protein